MGNRTSAAQIHAAEQKHLKVDILRKVDEFPVTLRDAIAETKEEDAETFLSIVEGRLIDLLYGNEGKGLDCNRDTEDEIETAIRFFPQVLCEKYWGIHPPIYAQLTYLKSVPFVPLLAKLGIELKQFQKEERGGLFYRKWNVLRSLVNDDWRDWYDEDDEPQQSLVEEKYCSVIRTLQRTGVFQRKDIREHGLMRALFGRHSFHERFFRSLVNWDPSCFKECCTRTTCVPDQPSIYRPGIKPNEIRVFRIIFELGMLHYPTEIAFLFHREIDGCTPFELACREYGTEPVIRIVRDVLGTWDNPRYGQESDADSMDHATNALIYAATDPAVHLDGVYFLLCREPGRYFHGIAMT